MFKNKTLSWVLTIALILSSFGITAPVQAIPAEYSVSVGSFQGEGEDGISGAFDWLKTNGVSGGNYTFTVTPPDGVSPDTIDYHSGVVISGMTVTFELNDYTLNIHSDASEGSKALEVGSGGAVSLNGAGSLNVYCNGYNGSGVYAHSGGQAAVTNAESSIYMSNAAYAISGGVIEITANASGTYTSIGTNTYCRAAYAEGNGSQIIIGGNAISANNTGVYAVDGGYIEVGGDVSGFYRGADAYYNATITIAGNVTASTEGAYASDGSTIAVGGDAIAEGNNGYGAYASGSGSSVTVAGNAIARGNFGAGAFAGYGGIVEVGGDAVSEGDDGYGVYATGTDAVIEVSGNVSALNGMGVRIFQDGLVTVEGNITVGDSIKHGIGVWIFQEGEVTVECTITATDYIKLLKSDDDYIIFSETDGEDSGGYRVYTYDTNTVRVKLVVPSLEGSGTTSDPYEIYTAQELAYVAGQVNLGTDFRDACYILMDDIDLQGMNWIPIGTADNSFRGYFDGNHQEISNLSIGSSSAYNSDLVNLGLFGYIDAGANVTNTGVTNIAIYSDASANTGGVAGFNAGTIDHCYAEGNIFAYSNLGGLTGYNKGNVLNSYTAVDLNCSYSSAGGLIGNNEGGNIINCYARGNVSSGEYPHAGGLVGYTVGWSGTNYITNCYASGDVSGSAWGYIGGIFGRSYSGTAFTNNFWNEDAQIIASEFHGYTPEVHGSADGYLAKPAVDMKSQAFVDLLNAGLCDAQTYYGWEIVSGVNDGFPVFKDTLGVSNPGTIQFEASSHGTYEGYNGWMIYVTRTDGSDGEVSVSYTMADGTAKAGIHYQAYSGTLTWADGDSSRKVIMFTAYNDSIYNGYLDLNCILSNPTGGAVLGEQNPLNIRISDNDTPPVPAGLKAKAGNKKVDLSWNPVNSAYYKLYYATVNGEFTEDNSVSVYDGETYTMTELKNGTTYYFAVKAGHNIYFSDLSDTVSATPRASGGGGGGGGYTPPVKEDPAEEPQELEITEPVYTPVDFDDVPQGAWFKEAVDFISGRGIAAGIGDNKFGPDMELTRGQFVVMLMNAFEISPQLTEDDLTVNFADAGNTYYTDYLLKARSLGIISGVGEDLFAPDKAITRQEMSLMLYNALNVIGKLPAAAVDKEIDSFRDSEEIAEWAYEAMASLVKAGIISGSYDRLDPIATTTRAQMAQVLYKLLQK